MPALHPRRQQAALPQPVYVFAPHGAVHAAPSLGVGVQELVREELRASLRERRVDVERVVTLGDANERVRGVGWLGGCNRVALRGGFKERLRGGRVGREPLRVRAQARRVRVGHAEIAHGKRVELDALQLRLDAFPLREDPGCVGFALEEGVPYPEHRRRVLDVVADAAGVLDHALDDPPLEPRRVGRVSFPVEVLHGVYSGGLESHDGGSVAVSEERRYCLELRAPGCGVPADDAFRGVHGEVRAALGDFAARGDVLGRTGGVGISVTGVI